MTEIEEIKYVKSLIESLARGVNPLNGESVPDNEVINNVKISRCLFYVVDVLERLCQGEHIEKEKKLKTPHFIEEGELEKFEYADYGIAISDITKRINNIISYNGRKVKRTMIVKRLIEDGYISESEINGRKYRLPTDKGIQAGIYTEERFGYNGAYKVVLYDRNAQRIVIEYLKSLGNDTDSKQLTENINQVDSNRGKPWDSKQEEELIEMFKDGLSIKEIANAMKRSVGGIRARLIKLGLINDTDEV